MNSHQYLKIGDKVRIQYGREEGTVGNITHQLTCYGGKTVYGVHLFNGIDIEVASQYVKKEYDSLIKKCNKIALMKIKSYKMVIIPFEYVPHRVIFRYKYDWWRRIVGTAEQAEKFIDVREIVTPNLNNEVFIMPNELVITNKSNLEKNISHAHVIEEFDLPNESC